MKKDELDKILNPNDFTWIKVKRNSAKRKENPDGHLGKTEFNDLLDHHEKETTFLINKCRELALELLKMKEYYE
jgi:hypothetical protein